MAGPSLTVMSVCALFVLVMTATVSSGFRDFRGGRGWGRGLPRFPRPFSVPENQCLSNLPACAPCGRPINVTIVARNQLQGSNFVINATLTNQPQSVLLHFLEQAVEENVQFKFEATYFATLGYFINSINNVRGETADQTYWQIISETNNASLECGVSTYVPKNGEVILFNFTTWS